MVVDLCRNKLSQKLDVYVVNVVEETFRQQEIIFVYCGSIYLREGYFVTSEISCLKDVCTKDILLMGEVVYDLDE